MNNKLKKSRILICGGRKYNDNNKFIEVMNKLLPWFNKDFCIIQGGANGADKLAMVWAFFQGCPMIEMRANWDYYETTAGTIRNTWMIKYATPDLIVAFPGGTGTANMIKQARVAGIDIFEVK